MEIYGINYIWEDDDGCVVYDYFSAVYYKNKNKAIKGLLEENFYNSGESAEGYVIYQSSENEKFYARIREVFLF